MPRRDFVLPVTCCNCPFSSWASANLSFNKISASSYMVSAFVYFVDNAKRIVF
jgi:hypothetical protein